MSPMTLRRPSAAWSALALALLSFLALPPAADAAFPGANGKIAFFSDRDGGFGIYTMNPDGSGQTRLGNDPSVWGTDSAWSPDGTKVAFGNLGISTINADGTGLTSIGGGPSASGPAWSPDGTKIAFVNQIEIHAYLPEIWTMNADGTNQTAVSTPPFNDQYPAWSPDGTKIALMGFGDGQNDIYTMNPDGSDRAKVTNDAASEGPPNWSPDGSRIAFDRSEGSSNSGEEIYVVKPDGTSLVNLTNNAEARDMVPAWSPDGTKIAFMSDRDGNWEIYVMNANGTGGIATSTLIASTLASTARTP